MQEHILAKYQKCLYDNNNNNNNNKCQFFDSSRVLSCVDKQYVDIHQFDMQDIAAIYRTVALGVVYVILICCLFNLLHFVNQQL